MDQEVVTDPVAYPTEETWDQGKDYEALPRSTTRLMESLFMQVRNGLEVKLD